MLEKPLVLAKKKKNRGDLSQAPLSHGIQNQDFICRLSNYYIGKFSKKKTCCFSVLQNMDRGLFFYRFKLCGFSSSKKNVNKLLTFLTHRGKIIISFKNRLIWHKKIYF